MPRNLFNIALKNKPYVMALVLAILFVGCDGNKIFEEYIEVENAIWKQNNVASFEFDIQDTSSAHNLYINVRNSGDYPYSNLYMFVLITGPDGQSQADTVNVQLADKRGRWLGNGVGDLWDLQMPYVGGFKFANKGKYVVSFEQAMRNENGIEGITDVGLRVEKREN